MNLRASKTDLSGILPFRPLFLQENNCQIRYDACHVRNWCDSYLLTVGGQPVGYGSVKGKEDLQNRDAIFEFYVVPAFRKMAGPLFSALIKASGPLYIECQTNDRFLTSLVYEFAQHIYADTVLFADQEVTEYPGPELIFRSSNPEKDLFGRKPVSAGAYVLEKKGVIVATGGFLLHYNPPFADLFMEVKHDCRRQGLGTFILQELKRECYLAGRVPAARCRVDNYASKATLQKAGFKICGYMLCGKVTPDYSWRSGVTA